MILMLRLTPLFQVHLMDFCFECAELLRGKFRRPGNRGYGHVFRFGL
jgi:hypothetical protein